MNSKKTNVKCNSSGIELLPAMKDQGYKLELWDADPNCEHVLDPNCWSGVKCLKCKGWYCY